MKILLACESSNTVSKEFRKLGHTVISCDLLPNDEDNTNHYQGDVFDIINDEWDFIGAHPSCQYVANSGVRWLYDRDGSKNITRWIELEKAVNFFNLLKYKIKKGYLENPIPHKYARDGFFSVITGEWVTGIGGYSQIIQPYHHGHTESKATCLWLINLELLEETNNVKEEMKKLPKNISQRLHYLPPSKDRWKIRSKTYPGIAKAMANQWGSPKPIK